MRCRVVLEQHGPHPELLFLFFLILSPSFSLPFSVISSVTLCPKRHDRSFSSWAISLDVNGCDVGISDVCDDIGDDEWSEDKTRLALKDMLDMMRDQNS